jgi:hypothetical protein
VALRVQTTVGISSYSAVQAITRQGVGLVVVPAPPLMLE